MPKSGSPRHFLLSASLLLKGSVACLHPAAIFAQSTSGDVVGTVSDPTGAAAPHDTVTATTEATAVAITVTANENGEFHLSNLPAGHYTLKGSAPGFQTFSLQGFTVTLNQTATASLRPPVASTATNVEVSAQAQTAIDTTTIQLQQTFTTKETQDLPMATIGLGAPNLSLLSPGVATSGGIGAGTGPAVGGQRPRNNNFTVEGIDDNDTSSQNNQFRFRYMYLQDSTTDTSANLGAFWLPVPNRYHLFAATCFKNFRPT